MTEISMMFSLIFITHGLKNKSCNAIISTMSLLQYKCCMAYNIWNMTILGLALTHVIKILSNKYFSRGIFDENSVYPQNEYKSSKIYYSFHCHTITLFT